MTARGSGGIASGGVLAPDSMFIGTATRMCENVEVTRLWHRPRHPRQKDCRWRCEGQGENQLLRAADGAKFRDWIAADANPPAGGAKHRSVTSPEHQGANDVGEIEQREMEGHRDQLIGDVRRLVEKYRAIFDWDVPDIDQNAADRLILVEVRKALDDIEKKLLS